MRKKINLIGSAREKELERYTRLPMGALGGEGGARSSDRGPQKFNTDLRKTKNHCTELAMMIRFKKHCWSRL